MSILGLLIDVDVGCEGVETPTSSLLENLHITTGSAEPVPRLINIFDGDNAGSRHLNSS